MLYYSITAREVEAREADMLDLGETGRARRLVHATLRLAPEGGHLAHVNTMRVYTRGAPGSIPALAGGAEIVAEGTRAWGDAGGLGVGPDALLLMPPGGVAVVIFSGGLSKGQGVRIIYAPLNGTAPRLFDPGENGRPELRPGPKTARALAEKLQAAGARAPKTIERLRVIAEDCGPASAPDLDL